MIRQRMMKPSRRDMLATMAARGAAVLGSSVSTNLSFAQDSVDPRVARIVADTISVDMHNHVRGLSFTGVAADRKPDPDIELSGQMKKSGACIRAFHRRRLRQGPRMGPPGVRLSPDLPAIGVRSLFQPRYWAKLRSDILKPVGLPEE